MTASPSDDDLGDRLLDLVLYAPLGLALEAKDLLPKLAARQAGGLPLLGLPERWRHGRARTERKAHRRSSNPFQGFSPRGYPRPNGHG